VRGPARRGTHLSDREKHERKQRVLTKTTPSLAGSIADAVVIKNGDCFFLTDPDGRVPLKKGRPPTRAIAAPRRPLRSRGALRPARRGSSRGNPR